jgi:hypothetical protein
LATDHLVHIYEKMDCLGHEILSPNMPRDRRLIGLRLKGELRGVCGRKGLEEFSLTLINSLGRLSMIVASLTHFVVARPRMGAPVPAGALVGLLHRRIDFQGFHAPIYGNHSPAQIP